MEKDPTPLLMMPGILIRAAPGVKQYFWRRHTSETRLRQRKSIIARITKAQGATDRTLSKMKTGAARREGRRARFLVSKRHL
jgi:hypothetical protein